MTGTIKLYKMQSENINVVAEVHRYYSVKERKKILIHWERKYNGLLINYFIQIAPGYLTDKK